MDPRDGRRPQFMRPVIDQLQLTPTIQFLQSADMTFLLAAACVAIGAMIAHGAASGPAVTGVDSVATAMAFG
jgi:hypothetical protein